MTATVRDFFNLPPDQQWALAAQFNVDMSTTPYTTPFENARLMMYRARQAGTLTAMLAGIAEIKP